jgi:tetratricopeptide (TPR) repeat protein
LNEWTHGDLMTVHMMGMVHTEFSSMYQRNENVWADFPQVQKADYPRADGIPGYGWMARYTLAFLNGYLKHDAQSMAWLKRIPAENGAPPHFFYTNFRAATGLPATLDAFRAEVGRKGFDHINEVYDEFRKSSPDFRPPEAEVNIWDYELMSDGHLSEAVAALKLNTTLYPGSGNTYDSLGDAYAKAGQKDLAIDNYKKAVATHYPEAGQSQQKLNILEKEQTH